jgi:hypothetical protein
VSLTRKDAEATLLTVLIVLVFAAAHQGWNVWLIGGSERWAAGTILVLGSWGASMIRHSRTVVPAHGAR